MSAPDPDIQIQTLREEVDKWRSIIRLGPGLLFLLSDWERTGKHGSLTLKFKGGNIIDVGTSYNTHVKDLPVPASYLFPELGKPEPKADT